MPIAESLIDLIGATPLVRLSRLARGLLRSGEVVKPTSGNAGIGLAFVGALRGYRLMPLCPPSDGPYCPRWGRSWY